MYKHMYIIYIHMYIHIYIHTYYSTWGNWTHGGHRVRRKGAQKGWPTADFTVRRPLEESCSATPPLTLTPPKRPWVNASSKKRKIRTRKNKSWTDFAFLVFRFLHFSCTYVENTSSLLLDGRQSVLPYNRYIVQCLAEVIVFVVSRELSRFNSRVNQSP